jgi:hypothetical protein
MDKLDDDWGDWGEPVAEELKAPHAFEQFAEIDEPKEFELKPLEIGKDVKDRINTILSKNQKYLKEVADFNAKPKQCFTAERYPNGFKLSTSYCVLPCTE